MERPATQMAPTEAVRSSKVQVPSLDAIAALPARELPAVALALAAAQSAVAARMANLATEPRDERYADAEQVAAELAVDPAWVYRQAARWPFAVKLSAKVLRIERVGLRRWLTQRRRR